MKQLTPEDKKKLLSNAFWDKEEYYLNKLYPFQDKILREIQSLDVDFYLSGGTTLKIKHKTQAFIY